MSSLQYPWPQTPAPGTTLEAALALMYVQRFRHLLVFVGSFLAVLLAGALLFLEEPAQRLADQV